MASIIENIFKLKNPLPDIKKSLALGYNVARIWALSGHIIRHQSYFYKVL
jgi:hypothetical protein